MAMLNVDGDKAIYYEHYAGPAGRITPASCSSTAGGCRAGCGTPSCRRCSTPDTRSSRSTTAACGSSDKDFADTSIAAIAADVVALVDHLSLDHPGGQRLVARRRRRRRGGRQARRHLGGLVLTCGATPRYVQDVDYPHGGTVDDLEATMAALGADRAAFLAGSLGGVCHADVGQPVIDWMWQIFMQASPRADAALRDLGNVDHRRSCPTITAPALVIGGTHDAIVPFGIAEVAAELLPAATLADFEDERPRPVPRGERPLPRRAGALRRLDLTRQIPTRPEEER